MDPTLKLSLLIATGFTGVLCGASLDQSFKQLPARHRIGAVAFSNYAKAADLKNGVIWYTVIGIGSTLSSITTAFVCWQNPETDNYNLPIYLAALFTIGQSICTSQAAPLYFKQKGIADEVELKKLFNKFEFIQTIRSVFIALNFAAFVYTLYQAL